MTLLVNLIGFLSLLGVALAQGVYIPAPTGSYNVSITSVDLSDASSVLLFYPVDPKDCHDIVDQLYMSDAVAKAESSQFLSQDGGFDRIFFKVCNGGNATLNPADTPLVVLEPQANTVAEMYSAMAQEIASQNFAVIVINHASEFDTFVKLPNSNETLGNRSPLSPYAHIKSWNSTVSDAVDARTHDIKDLLDNFLTDQDSVQKLLWTYNISSAFKTDKVGLIGHGLGGSAVSQLSFDNSTRFPMAINMAGTPPTLDDDTQAYTIFFGQDPGFMRTDDIHWPSVWPHLTGSAVEYDMQKGGIMDFSDLPLIVDLRGLNSTRTQVRGLGEVGSRAAWRSVADIAGAYMEVLFIDQQDASYDLAVAVQHNPVLEPYTPGEDGAMLAKWFASGLASRSASRFLER